MSYAQKSGEDISIGKYEIIHSEILNEDRTLLIHLPRGYEGAIQSYPVLYMLYGNHVTTYFAEAVSVLDNLGPTGRIPEFILVGIMNTDRYRDLLPLTDDGYATGIEAFTQFLKQEVYTFIEKNYRTKDYRILVGPQAGANFALYTLFEHPDLFDACLINNPFRWRGGREVILDKAKSFFEKNSEFKKSVFMTYDDSDPLSVEGVELIETFSRMIETYHPKGFSLALNFIEQNDEFLQPLGIKKGLKELFSDYPFPEEREVEELDDVISFYKELSQRYGYEVDPPEHVLTVQSDKLMERGKMAEVVSILEYAMEHYPRAANSYFRMSNILFRGGELEPARDYLKKAVELIPFDSGMLSSRLARLERRINESAVYQIDKVIRRSGIKAGIRSFRKLRAEDESPFYFEEREFNELGYRLMGAGDLPGAIEILKLNVEMFPESANAYDSLGEAFMNNGDNQNAILNYRKSLELNPENSNAVQMLEKLEKK